MRQRKTLRNTLRRPLRIVARMSGICRHLRLHRQIAVSQIRFCRLNQWSSRNQHVKLATGKRVIMHLIYGLPVGVAGVQEKSRYINNKESSKLLDGSLLSMSTSYMIYGDVRFEMPCVILNRMANETKKYALFICLKNPRHTLV